MNQTTWLRLCEIFEKVRELAREDRDAVLEELVGGDAALRQEAMSLLAWHERAEGFLEQPVSEAGEDRRIGPYRLLSVLGVGGMSVVYLAERDDGEYDKRVAIKLLPAGMLRGIAALGEALPLELVQRLRAERQILARLEHPSIAKLLDGGTTEEGLPYLVMEYVEGERIDDYCRHHGSSLRERLLLFRKVCAAVQFAHQHLVVHRDLKPSNLLVTADGEPRLLDFGIAKLLNSDEAEPKTLPADRAGRLMTPEYASPEQVRGEAITTATDVYALGALLYELLTGRRAQRLGTRTPEEIHRAVCLVAPEKPSRAIAGANLPAREARRLARQLEGDLDNIVLRALRKEPARRYGSAAELAEDLDRYLDGRPVRARGEGALYRAGKFVRRHRVGVAAAAGVAGVLAFLVWNLALERRRALEERDSAQALSELLVDRFVVPGPRGLEPSASLALRQLAETVDRIDSALRDQPRTRAALLDTLGRLYAASGRYEEAEDRLAAAVALRREVDPSAARLSLFHLGRALRLKGDFAAAERHLREALNPGLGRETRRIAALTELGTVLRRQNRWGEATLLYEEAEALARLLPRGVEASPLEDAREVLALARHELAVAWFDLGRYGASEALVREALVLKGPPSGPPDPLRASMLHTLGRLALRLGRYGEARSHLEQALLMKRELYGPRHLEIFFTLWHLSQAIAGEGELARARELGEEALVMGREVVGADNPSYLLAMSDQAGLVASLEGPAAAEGLARGAVAGLRGRPGVARRHLGPALGRLASLRRMAGELEEAERLAEEAVASQATSMGPEHAETAVLRVEQARILFARGANEQGLRVLRAALPVLQDTLGAAHPEVASLRGWGLDNELVAPAPDR